MYQKHTKLLQLKSNRQNCPYPHSPPEKLFKGIFPNWQALTGSEKLICANIILLPFWWLIGISNYLLLFLSLGIIINEWLRYGRIRSLKPPSWLVITIFAFFAYDCLDKLLIFLDAYPSIEIPKNLVISPNDLVKSAFQFSIPFLVWYVESNKFKIRLEVFAWACSVSVIQMLLGWLVIQFFLTGWIENPPRNLYAILTGKGSFTPGDVGGWTNYLAYYDGERVRFFFGHYQIAAAFLGFIALISIELKNRVWSFILIGTCIFLLVLIGSRSVWLALPLAFGVRFFLTLIQLRLAAMVFGCLAIFSFATLSFPPITNLIFATSADIAGGVANFRAGSTEIRSLVYKETLEKIPQKPIFGHKVEGAPAIEGNASVYIKSDAKVRIGSHSFILGELLYKKGLLGMGLFFAAWGLLIHWFSQTQKQALPFWLPVLTFLFLQCFVTSLNPIGTNTLLLMMIKATTQPKQLYPGVHSG